MNKQTVKAMLADDDDGAVLAFAQKDFPLLMRRLIAITYDKTDPIGWRAIEVVGKSCGAIQDEDPAAVRSLAQRLLWMMRDESGNNPGSAPELLGEMVRNCPDALSDIPPIIASFQDELMLRRGVARALYRIAVVRPDLVQQSDDFWRSLLRDADPGVRANAVLAVAALQREGLSDIMTERADDRASVQVYRNGRLETVTVAALAGEAALNVGRRERHG